MKIKFWGVRGSIPTPGESTKVYGGNTSCVSIEDKDETLIFDGGSGLRECGIEIMKNRQFGAKGPYPLTMHLFFSHVHWDHIQGVPFFKPLFIQGNNVHMYGEKKVRTCLEDTLKGQQQYPNFPISIEEIGVTGACMDFTDLFPGQQTTIGDMVVTCTKLSHPDGVFSYNILHLISGKSITYATDTEHRNVLDPRLLKIAKNSDVLIYDAQYTPEEYEGIGGIPRFDWGHSTYEWGVKTAIAAGVKRLILFHHEPEHTDDMIEEIEAKARNYKNEKATLCDDEAAKIAENLTIDAAFEGMKINLN